ncbi:MAG: methyltransferase domain-containing protein [Candidatus Heimdallarchaeota archaeon]|nr:methyltransferase domain-containing protein [Candidatus Heimdallarchaeota archaeon]
MPKIEPFNKYADKYEEWFEKNKFVYLSELRAIKQLIPKKGRGLEISVGSGRFAEPLGIEEGIDPSQEMREIAQIRGIKVYEGVAENLPFKNESFDYLLMITTICFVDDINASFKEAYRVLKPKGLFIIGFVDKKSPLGERYLQYKEENVFYKQATFYSCEEVIALLKEYNFSNLEVVQTVFGRLEKIKETQNFKPGYGKGGFVVIKAEK